MAHATPSISLNLTWGEWGNLYSRAAELGESAVVRPLRRDLARALAAAQALSELGAHLNSDQAEICQRVIKHELAKQGFAE